MIESIPLWVYIVFALVVSFGIRASRPRSVPFRQLLLFPLILLLFSLYALWHHAQGRYAFLPLWGAALILGAFLGYAQVRAWPLKADRARGTLSLPGSWVPLCLALAIFALRFAFVYSYETIPHALQNGWVFGADVFCSGAIVGMFIGRFYRFRQKYLE